MTPTLVEVATTKKKKRQQQFFEQIDERLIAPHKQPVWFQGNAASASDFIQKNSIDVIITSPPYD